MKIKVFVDGQEGTTGLKIFERLAVRDDVEILRIPEELRKDAAERGRYLNEADVAFLCLPDVAAKEAVSLITNDRTRVIDASTAHRTAEGWTYGIPELGGSQYEAIRNSKRVSVPGCYATGFTMLMFPLVSGGIVPKSYPVTCHAVTGYSGGGKGLISEFETNPQKGRTPAFYALGLSHKHLPEMQKHSGLDSPPLFTPIIGNYHNGMSVAVPLRTQLLDGNVTADGIAEYLKNFYAGRKFVKVYSPREAEAATESGYFYADACNGTNSIEIFVFGNGSDILLMSRLDNLGKGASAQAVQCMNVMFGIEEDAGLKAI